jgi:hypothetical protein
MLTNPFQAFQDFRVSEKAGIVSVQVTMVLKGMVSAEGIESAIKRKFNNLERGGWHCLAL